MLNRNNSNLIYIIWRMAKQLVSLLEKKYGFSQKAFRNGKDNIGVDVLFLEPGMRFQKLGEKWPIYHIGTPINESLAITCEWATGTISGFADAEELICLARRNQLVRAINLDD